MTPTLERVRRPTAPVRSAGTTVVTAPSPTALARPPEALIEEARRRARRRRSGIAALLCLGVAVVGALIVIGDGGTSRRSGGTPPNPAGGLHREALALLRQPFMGVACPAAPNSIACDRVGLVVQLRSPAARVTATIAGRPVKMNVPANTNCSSVAPDRVCGRYFEGFLQPAGLLDGPLKVRPDAGRYYWIGSHPVFAPVRIVAHYSNGHTASITQRVELHPGYG